jgi:hypothetical protein
MRARAIVRSTAVLSSAILVATACGSTAPPEVQQQIQQANGTELGTAPTTLSGLPAGAHVNKKGQVVNAKGEVIGNAEDFGLSSGTNGGSEGAAGANGPSGGGGTVGGGGGSTSSAVGPGITASKIYIGVPWSDAGAANEAFTGAAINSDARKPYNAMVEEINKGGGIGGRQVEVIYKESSVTSSETQDQQDQAACAHWTDDNHVFAMTVASDILRQCAEEAGAVALSPVSVSAPSDFQKYPHYVEISGMNLYRVGEVTVGGLDREGYFGGGAKLGVVLWDEPNYRAALENGYMPALRERGIRLATEPAYISSPQTADDLAAASADVNNAVLRFQSQGITHVLLLDGNTPLCRGACLGTLFLRRAESQSYRPRYGFNPGNAPAAAQEAGLYPTEQLPRSISVEWTDADEAADEGWRLNKARERCYAIMRKHNVPLSNGNEQADARTACQTLWFLQSVIDVKMPGNVINSDAFIAGVNALGWAFPSPTAYAVHFSPTQHDGIAAARNMKFVTSCDCYRYVTDPYRV